MVYKFAESANESAGEFYTPRDIVRLATTLVIAPDNEALAGEGVIRTVYDPAAGTGGFLSAAIEQIKEWNPGARLVPYAQELNAETYAIQVADKLIQGYDTRNLKLGNTLSDDQLAGESFHYGLSNPPFGVDWKGIRTAVEAEHKRGYAGRFGPGTPRVSDGSMLFLLHLLSKRRPKSEGGSRFGIVLSGSPLFTGGAGSGESEIRRWILEQDLLEAIVALPGDMFYNTGIATYVWILSNHKSEERAGKVQLIDATGMFASMRKSLGNKRRYLTDEHIAERQAARRVRGGRAQQDLRHHRLRLPAHHGRAPLAAHFHPARRGRPGRPAGGEGVAEARGGRALEHPRGSSSARRAHPEP